MFNFIKKWLKKVFSIKEREASVRLRFTYKQILREYNDNRPQISNSNKEWDKIWKLQ